jgi:DNA-3-methyladenine glycosylase
MRPLPRSFYARPTAAVAADLIGKILVRGRRRARIVEVEAYLGVKDKASHARFGPTPRTRIMFGPPGHLYVYLVYGMHHCMNVVTEKDGVAGAVLLRAAAPLGGSDPRALSGPGKLCARLGVTRKDNGLDLTKGGFFLTADDEVCPAPACSPRIGVDYAGSWTRRRLRFYWRGHPSVSGKPR